MVCADSITSAECVALVHLSMAINLSTHRLPQPVKKRKTASYINKITIGDIFNSCSSVWLCILWIA